MYEMLHYVQHDTIIGQAASKILQAANTVNLAVSKIEPKENKTVGRPQFKNLENIIE
jgi:hypothetical protein